MEWLQKHPDDLLKVHPGTFELIVAELFRDQGFDVEVLGSWNQADGGIDVIAIRKNTIAGDFRVGIQCKRYVRTRSVRADLVWALEGRLDKFHLNKGVVATTARFEPAVLADLKQHLWRVELKDYERLKSDLETWGQYNRAASGLWLPK
jgi:restriction endonuclease Mrr